MISAILFLPASWAISALWAAPSRQPSYGRIPEETSYSHWLSSGQAGYAMLDDTPLRSAAYSQGDVLALAPAGAALDIVLRTPFWERIGDLREPWYTVKLPGKPGQYAEVWGGHLARISKDVRIAEKPATLLVGITTTTRDSQSYPNSPVPRGAALLVSEGRVLGKTDVPLAGYAEGGSYDAELSVQALGPASGLGRQLALFSVESVFEFRGYGDSLIMLVWDGDRLVDGLAVSGSGGDCSVDVSFVLPGDPYGRPSRIGVKRRTSCEGDESPPEPVYSYWRWEAGRFVGE